MPTFSFSFPPPFQAHQRLHYKGGAPARTESKLLLINRPPRPEEEVAIAAHVEEGGYLVGISAFENWPERVHNPEDAPALRGYDLFSRPYYRRFIGFMTHRRAPRDVFPDDLPLLDMDFSDYVQVRKKGLAKTYDLIYYAGHKIEGHPATVAWSRVIKQHDLALGLIREILATEPGARVCLVRDSFEIDDPRVERFDYLPYRAFLDKIESSRILLMASELDASPRVITEALCLDTRVMVNARILGGWKYVNEETGAFFDRESALDVYRRLRALGPAGPRAWFLRNYPNDVLEDRFNAWLNRSLAEYSVWNRFGRVLYLNAGAAEAQNTVIRRELFGHMAVYGDCVERIPRDAGRAAAHVAALRRARDLGLPDVVILEDDFQCVPVRQAANHRLGALLAASPEWDVIQLDNRRIRASEGTRHAPAVRVRDAALPSGYVARARVYDALIAALEEAGEAGIDEAWARQVKGCVTLGFAAVFGDLWVPPRPRPPEVTPAESGGPTKDEGAQSMSS